MTTPLHDFIHHKAQTGMQCGNYSIDLPPLNEGEHYRFHFNATLCVGCHCCEVACNEVNANPPFIKWRRVGEMEGGEFPHVSHLFNSMSCNHCLEPACLKGCPTQAYTKTSEGIVLHDSDICIGCHYCTWNCPYQVPVYNPLKGSVSKCHMCYSKLHVGQTPACVQACPAGAIEIEAVDQHVWLNDIHTQGIAPLLPDVSITKPTTRYTISPSLPPMTPADSHHLTPHSPEIPLVLMTLLTQFSWGGVVALTLGSLMSFLGFPSPSLMMILSLILLCALGLSLSTLHLGKPFFAYRAFKNIKHSWLSQEALALSLFIVLLCLSSILEFFGLSSLYSFITLLLASLIGGYGIYAQSKIYCISSRPSWNQWWTPWVFLSVGYGGLMLVSTLLLVHHEIHSSVSVSSLTLIIALFRYIVFEKENHFYHTLSLHDTPHHPLMKTYSLRQKYQTLLHIQRIGLIIGGLIAPLLTLVLAYTPYALTLSIIGIMFAWSSEFIGRYLFYRCVGAWGLAGNFFAGNQRS